MSDKEKRYNYQNPRIKEFMDFIRSAVKEAGGITELSKKTGISRPTITFWYNGERAADAEQLVKLSQKLNVSIDYMLTGVSTENREISSETGLSNGAIDCLRYLNRRGNKDVGDKAGKVNRETISFINRVLETEGQDATFLADGDTKFKPTLFRLMEQYVCSAGATGTMSKTHPVTKERTSVTDSLICFDDPNMEEFHDVATLRREALLSQIRGQLEEYRKLEEAKDNGKHKTDGNKGR